MGQGSPIRIFSGNAERAAFRDELRAARETCARDAEAFDQLLFVVERLGSRLSGSIATLGAYKQKLSQLAQESDLSKGEGDSDFLNLFAMILEARNDALHQGAVARQTTSRVIELALILEDALARDLKQVDFLMVKNPTVANPWQTVAAIRQIMLANAFSYLPIYWEHKWYFVSDYAVARFLHQADDRKAEMARTFDDLLNKGPGLSLLIEATSIPKGTSVREVVAEMKGGVPILVRGIDESHLAGLVSPADLL